MNWVFWNKKYLILFSQGCLYQQNILNVAGSDLFEASLMEEGVSNSYLHYRADLKLRLFE